MNRLGYSCICEQGWRKSNETESCTLDIDECKEMRPHCSVDPQVSCVNVPGSFSCGSCPAGYSGNGYYCVDINECEVDNGGCSVAPKVECINSRVSKFHGVSTILKSNSFFTGFKKLRKLPIRLRG